MNVSRSRHISVFLLAILLGLVQFAVIQAARLAPVQDLDEDRPPIIVSGGSVIIQTAGGAWERLAGTKQFKQNDARRKSVKTFSARTGTCTVEGSQLVVTYGANEIKFSAKRSTRSDKDDAAVEFPSAADVSETTPGTLRVTTSDVLVSVSNGRTSCKVVGNITISQKR
jgi:hypothetical protein